MIHMGKLAQYKKKIDEQLEQHLGIIPPNQPSVNSKALPILPTKIEVVNEEDLQENIKTRTLMLSDGYELYCPTDYMFFKKAEFQDGVFLCTMCGLDLKDLSKSLPPQTLTQPPQQPRVVATTGVIQVKEKLQPDWDKVLFATEQLTLTLNRELGWFDSEALVNTPKRIAKFYKEFYNKSDGEVGNFNVTTFDTDIDTTRGMIAINNIKGYSLCKHHMLPFEFKAAIVYLPREGGRIIGASKLPRAVIKFASKPQVQEELTNEIATFLEKQLNPWFLMVTITEASHFCIRMRGVMQESSYMATNAIRWDKQKFPTPQDLDTLKSEALTLIK